MKDFFYGFGIGIMFLFICAFGSKICEMDKKLNMIENKIGVSK